MEAARVANEAAATALAAAARIDTDIGEINVQADWNEQDDTQDAYIRNKPTIPVVAGNVGAPLTHAARHAANGEDAVSPASILAAGKSVLATATLSKNNWSSNSYTLTATDVAALAAVTAATAWEVLPGLSATNAEIEALQAANLLDGGQSAGSITLRAKDGAPTIDMPIRIILRGDLY